MAGNAQNGSWQLEGLRSGNLHRGRGGTQSLEEEDRWNIGSKLLQVPAHFEVNLRVRDIRNARGRHPLTTRKPAILSTNEKHIRGNAQFHLVFISSNLLLNRGEFVSSQGVVRMESEAMMPISSNRCFGFDGI